MSKYIIPAVKPPLAPIRRPTARPVAATAVKAVNQTKRVIAPSQSSNRAPIKPVVPPPPPAKAQNNRAAPIPAPLSPQDNKTLLEGAQRFRKRMENNKAQQDRQQKEDALAKEVGTRYGQRLPEDWTPSDPVEALVYQTLGQPDIYGDADDMAFVFLDKALPTPKP